MFTFLSGFKAYALLGIGLVIVALAGSVAFLWQVHKADKATLAVAQQNLSTVSNGLKQAEADKADLARQIGALDEALKSEHDLQAKLEKDKRAISEKLDEIKKTLPQEDKSCMDRGLPDAVLGLLRGGPVDPNPDSHSQGSGKPADPLH